MPSFPAVQTVLMASESLQCKTLVLRVSIHCEGCKKKVKKVLQSVQGVYKCDIDARSNKATVAVTGKVSADALIKKLRRSRKHAEKWPEEKKQQHRPTDSQNQEAKNQTTKPDNPGEPTNKPASGEAATNPAEQSNPNTSPEEPKKSSGETAKPDEESTESANVSVNGNADAHDNVSHGGTKEATAEQFIEPKTKRKQQQQEEMPVGAKAAALPDQASYVGHPPPPLQQQQPVHVVSYNVARPSASSAYYAAAQPSGRSKPQEHSYSYSHSPYYDYHSQPSPYGYYYHYGHGTPPRSAASPARDSYVHLFSDDNANSCSVM